MKLIFSRKGFDSSSGGVPSPIFPDGRMVSLPIPDKRSKVTYADISFDGVSLGPIVSQLTGGRIPSHYRAHIDPDLAQNSLPRLAGWRPIFGQTGPAQGHLRNNGVGPGDLFLFFGLFKRVEVRDDVYAWDTNVRSCHVIWGWLQIAEVLPIGNSKSPSGYEWAAYHPHFDRVHEPNNVVYVASRHLEMDGVETNSIPGAGVFSFFSTEQQLTASRAEKTTTWNLPAWFHPTGNRMPLTYHRNVQRWRRQGERTELKTVSRGQEFILDCDEYPEAVGWACDLLQKQQFGKTA
ncbi:MAG: hypothetical protein OXF97_05260 [Nitrospira sp.]|nr:hypothetical protein [Nitrospira sp.]